MINVERAISVALKTGKAVLGVEETVENAKAGKAKIIILASNCPKTARENIERYCKLSDIPLYIYKGSSIDLGMACGKPFLVSAITVKETGDSDILKLVETHQSAQIEEEEAEAEAFNAEGEQ